MTKRHTFRLIAAVALMGLLLAFAGTSLAQDGASTPPAPPAPACVADAAAGTSCVKIVFYPATLKADLFIGDVPSEQAQQSTLYVTFTNATPSQTMDISARNIHDGGAGEGQLYQYPDIATTVTAPYAAGQTSTVTLYPVKKYIRGKIEAKCAPLAVQPGEDVACTVSIDGVAQTIPMPPPTPGPDGVIPAPAPPATTLAAGQKATFIVEPGPHEVKFDLVGASASLWPPMTQTKAVTVTAGAYPQLATATFYKAGHLVAKLAQADAGWVGDFYLDGTLIAPQAGSIDQWVTANASHKVDVRNITQTGSPLIHPYKDGSGSAYTYSGVTSNVTIAMNAVPEADMVLVADGSVVTTQDYVTPIMVWEASSGPLAEQNADHLHFNILLDGVDMGNVGQYRKPAAMHTEVSTCAFPDWTPCYIVLWKVPAGRLAAGQHTLTVPFTLDETIFNGWLTFGAGAYQLDMTFTVFEAAP